MIRKFIIPLLALVGILLAAYTVFHGPPPPPAVPAIADAPQSPYRNFVAGSGIVEASTENIFVGNQIPGVVSHISVAVGGNVRQGDPLFTIDDRALLAERAIRQANVKIATAEDAEARYDLSIAEPLAAKGVTTQEDLQKKRFAAQKANAQLAQATASLQSTETDLERLTVRAPVDGQILQLKLHPGEFAPVAATASGESPLLLLGSVSPLHVRVDVDENDAWRVREGAAAVGFLRGNREIKTPLTFVRFEPYVVPKKSLTGDSTERVDTRVLQIIFRLDRGSLPIFVGQQMDVFIDAPPRK